MFSAIIALILVLISTGFIVRNLILANEVNQANSKLDAIKATQDYQDATRLQDSIAAMSEYDNSADVALKAFQDAGILNVKLLNKLSASIPSSASFTSIAATNSKIEIYCDVPSRKVAAEVLLDLKNSGLFQDVQLGSVTTKSATGSAGYTVNISTILKAGGINE